MNNSLEVRVTNSTEILDIVDNIKLNSNGRVSSEALSLLIREVTNVLNFRSLNAYCEYLAEQVGGTKHSILFNYVQKRRDTAPRKYWDHSVNLIKTHRNGKKNGINYKYLKGIPSKDYRKVAINFNVFFYPTTNPKRMFKFIAEETNKNPNTLYCQYFLMKSARVPIEDYTYLIKRTRGEEFKIDVDSISHRVSIDKYIELADQLKASEYPNLSAEKMIKLIAMETNRNFGTLYFDYYLRRRDTVPIADYVYLYNKINWQSRIQVVKENKMPLYNSLRIYRQGDVFYFEPLNDVGVVLKTYERQIERTIMKVAEVRFLNRNHRTFELEMDVRKKHRQGPKYRN